MAIGLTWLLPQPSLTGGATSEPRVPGGNGTGTESYTLDALNRITSVDYPTGDDVAYTYDTGNIASMTV
jgi:hypothetical protein